jgi:hypothetical protein
MGRGTAGLITDPSTFNAPSPWTSVFPPWTSVKRNYSSWDGGGGISSGGNDAADGL